jgi:hypothetical protein
LHGRWHLALSIESIVNQSLKSEGIMKSSPWLFAAAMSFSGLALAQSAPSSGVTENTDPAKISAIEQHAQELASRPASGASGTSGASGASAATTDQGGDMKTQGTRKHKHKSTQKKSAKDKPASDTPMATENKGS